MDTLRNLFYAPTVETKDAQNQKFAGGTFSELRPIWLPKDYSNSTRLTKSEQSMHNAVCNYFVETN